MKKHIPNFLTLMNLLCGCIALIFASENFLFLSFVMLLWAALFDFIDGVAARLLDVRSEIGKQLDSLCDMVSFGVAPSFIIFQFMTQNKASMPDNIYFNLLPLFAFVITIFSALRLAKFNIDTRQNDSFIGLPTPANGLFFASLPLVSNDNFGSFFNLSSQFHDLLSNNVFMVFLLILFSYLLVSNLKLFAMKFKNLYWSENVIRYSFMICSVILIVLFYFQSIPLIVLLYICLSLFSEFKSKKLKVKS